MSVGLLFTVGSNAIRALVNFIVSTSPTRLERGSARLSKQVELIIANVIQTSYLSTSRPTKLEVHGVISDACEMQGLPPPSLPAVSRRIEQVPRKTRLKARGHGDIAKDTYEPTPNSYEANYPLHRIQIDHTPADVIIVDDVYRRPIGRPTLTLAIDMYTRLIVGYYLSLHGPSALSVAMCLVQAMLPKHKWLNLHEIDAEWNAWGSPMKCIVTTVPTSKLGLLSNHALSTT